MRLKGLDVSLTLGVGPLTFHTTLFDWRLWWFHDVMEPRYGFIIDRRDCRVGPFRVQYITSKKQCLGK
jgi:hypothetical protein